MVISRFEDIDAWKNARKLTKNIYDTTNSVPFSKDYALSNQIREASVSIMSNIAEGFGRIGNREFKHFLSIARGSVYEVQSKLYVALDAGYIKQDKFNEIFEIAQLTGDLISGFIRYLGKSELKSVKKYRY